MKSKFIIALAAAAMITAAATPLQAQATDPDPALQSLRGAQPVDETSPTPESRQVMRQNQPIPREFAQQPPLIPHSIANFRIDREENKCLACHVGTEEKKAVGTPISQTHYTVATGAASAELSAARYFCTQCHVPQTDAPPIVSNEFKPVSDTP
jgi:cytochrome c-type protein NapB